MAIFRQLLDHWGKVLSYHRQSHYKYGLASLLLRMGKIFDQQGYFNLATDYLTNALKISEKASYQYLTGEIIYEQTWVNYRSKNYDQALANLKKAENIFMQTKSKAEIAGSWDLQRLIERRLKHYDTAIYYHQKSLAGKNATGK